MVSAVGRLHRMARQISTSLTPAAAADSGLVAAPFAEAAARAAIALADSLTDGGARRMPGQMEVAFALQYIRRNVSCLGHAAKMLSVPTGRENAAALTSALRSLAETLSAGVRARSLGPGPGTY